MKDLNEAINSIPPNEIPIAGTVIKYKAKTYSFTILNRTFEFKTYVKKKAKSIFSCDEILCNDDAINERAGLMSKEKYNAMVKKGAAQLKKDRAESMERLGYKNEEL